MAGDAGIWHHLPGRSDINYLDTNPETDKIRIFFTSVVDLGNLNIHSNNSEEEQARFLQDVAGYFGKGS
jgi:hypothetical protein